jgi:hypothetical protein
MNIYGETECLRDHIDEIGVKLAKAGNPVEMWSATRMSI